MQSHTILRLAVLAFALVQVAQGLKKSSMSRIIGGTTVKEIKYKYYVRLHKEGNFICGGTLVRNNAVVTAAHCVVGGKAADFTVHAGSILLTDRGVARKVKAVRSSPKYNNNSKDSDVAVLILDSPIISDKTETIALRSTPVPDGTNCVIMGHGVTETGKPSYTLLEATVPTINKQRCQRSYIRAVALTPNMFCAGVPGAKDSCSGDSGGPLVCDGRLTGIVSFGVGCAQIDFPGVYTSVEQVSDFINQQLRLYK